MSRLKTNWLQIFNRILSACLVLLGFSACEVVENRVEYGTPYVEHEIKGKVVNEQKETISNARIIVQELHPYLYRSYESGAVLNDSITIKDDSGKEQTVYVHSYPLDTLYTNGKGEFEFLESYASGYFPYYRVIGGDDQLYKKDTVIVEMGEPVGDRTGWYEGKSTEEITIELKKMQSEE